MHYFVCEHSRLARTRAGYHKGRSVGVDHRIALLRVEFIQIIFQVVCIDGFRIKFTKKNSTEAASRLIFRGLVLLLSPLAFALWRLPDLGTDNLLILFYPKNGSIREKCIFYQ